MEDLHSKTDLQLQSVRDVMGVYTSLYGWTNATNLNDTGILGSPIAAFLVENGLADTIGLSVSDYLSIRAELRPIFFIDSSTKRADVDIIPLIESSVYLNSGWELVGDAATGYALYIEGTEEATLEKAKKYLSVKYYGVSYDTTNSNPDVTRVGLLADHRSLPVQSSMYACLLNDDGTENYKLDPADWTKKLDGTASNLDGTDGQVMIKLPEYWFRVESVGNTKRWLLSVVALVGYTRERPQYISAYEAALNRTTSKLASVKNATATFRGGNDNAAWDAESRTLLGKPATSISRTYFRTYARNRGAGWEMDNYLAQRTLLRFSLIEFATRNSQKDVNAALDLNGFKQGALGIGVTNINSTLWSTFNSYYPFIPCGSSDILGNATGDVVYAMPAEYGTLDTYVNRYRGVEMPFGHIWKNLDGVNLRIFADTEATPISAAFISDDPALWNDSDYVGLDNIGNLRRSNGYASELLAGELLPANTSGGSTTFWCDYFYTSLPASGESLRTVLLGGAAYYGSNAGLGCSSSASSPATTYANVGSRLCYIPSEAG